MDSEIVEMVGFLDPEIVEMVGFLDPEIVEMVDRSYIKSNVMVSQQSPDRTGISKSFTNII